MLSRSIIAASALVAIANALASTTVSQSMPPSATAGFNPADVNITVANTWCEGQRNSCPDICGGPVQMNTCDPVAFTYSCICADGTVPDCTAYAQTLPFFICQETFSQCILNNVGNAQGQQTCTADEVCGSKNATAASASAAAAATKTSSVSSAAASSGSTAKTTGGSSGSATASSTAATSSSPATNQHIATGAFAAILMAAFKLLI